MSKKEMKFTLIGIFTLSLIGCGHTATTTKTEGPASSIKMVVIDEKDNMREEPTPHGRIGMSTAYRISDAAPERNFEFRKRILHKDSAIGLHVINHDEIYYVLSGTGIVTSDNDTHTLKEGMSAYLYEGANVGIKQIGEEPLTLIIAYPLKARVPKPK